MPQFKLKKILSSHFFKYSLIPIFVVEVALLILYFSINAYISFKNTGLLLDEAQSHTRELLKNESQIISDKLNEVSRVAKILQYEHESIFKNPKNFGLPNDKPSFDVATNGVFYKTNNIGSSLYYSSQTKITDKEREKATFTEAMDITFKSVVDNNSNIVAAYFNSWDNMNRLYPFIDKVYEQYGEHINMEDYNFYFLADLTHNPKKEPVWTGAYLDPAGNGWMLSCVVPVYNNDFLEGVTGLDITIDSFVKNILNRELPYDANLFMVDKDGMIIAMPEKIETLLGLKELKKHLYTDAILKTIEKPEEFNILKNSSPFASHFKDLIIKNLDSSSLKIGEKEYLTLQQTVKETDWKLMILIDKDEIFDSIIYLKELSNKIGYVAILFLLVFYIVFFYLLLKRINKFSDVITEPLEKLSSETSKIDLTNQDEVIAHITTDVEEIHILNQNFVDMIKEIKEKTQKLYESKIIAEELSKAKDDFLANMSHELKTPLNSINVISDVMMRNRAGNLDEKQIKNLEIINKCGKDLLFLINDVLDISKLEAGQIIINNDKINVKQLFVSIYDMFYPQVKNKGLDFVFKVDDSLNFIYSDEDRIKQIVKNFLSNSLKFTEKGKVSLIVKDEDTNIRIIVGDEGIGIPEEKLVYIFDRFKQVDGSTTRKYGGTGLGLAISKELTILLDGDISVKSEIDKGSTFEIVLPKKEHLIQSFDMLDLKTEEGEKFAKLPLTNVFDKVEMSNENKKEILVYNNDKINFLFVISELKKGFDVKQFFDIDELIEEYKKSERRVLIDQKNLVLDDIQKIKLNILKENIIILYDEKVKDELVTLSHKIVKKPLKIDDLI